ncbi:uncharacterized protein LOC133196463 [Saccostrea echinata]|uniref:uncharacterized protein LOC133196463 n=1 Tax=Saccostrea echinata TaxID=191078 RepID=UPI002A80FDDE|nr:uncharacterized protein LOC133196463 [Saccostrea echinata]
MAFVLQNIKDLLSIPDNTVMQLTLPASLLMFAVTVPWGRKTLMDITSLIFAVKGFGALLYPEAVNFWFKKGVADGLHLQEIRDIGIILMALAFTHFMTRKSNDRTMEINLLWSRTMFFGAVFLLNAVRLINYDSKKEKISLYVEKLAALVTGLYFVAFLFYSLREDDWGGSTEQSTSKTHFHLRIDFVMFFVHGIIAYCFPEFIATFQTKLSSLDPLHDYTARLMGAGFLALGMSSGRANNCHHEEDKKSVLLGHGLANGLFFLTMLLCQLFSDIFSQWHVYGMCIVLLAAVNDFVGCEINAMVQNFKRELSSTKEE